MKLQNNTILITGGTSGLGYEFASKLQALGNTVIVTGRNQNRLSELQKKLPNVHTFQSDVSDPDAIKQLYADITMQFPTLNMLINNAGEMRAISLNAPTTDLNDITREVEINLMGPIRMVQLFLPLLKKQKNAAIMNVTSGLALTPFPVSPIYGATKSGLRSYTKSLRVQLKNTAVKVFELVAPASSTPLNDQFINVDGFDPKMMMDPGMLIDIAIKGLEKDQFEIYPGLARLLKIMSRLAPSFLLTQTSKVGVKIMEREK
jgi:uncharacterized oxidoreductase